MDFGYEIPANQVGKLAMVGPGRAKCSLSCSQRFKGSKVQRQVFTQK